MDCSQEMQLGPDGITRGADGPRWVSTGSFHNSSQSLRNYHPTAALNGGGPASGGNNHPTPGVNGVPGRYFQPAAGVNGRNYNAAADVNGRNYRRVAGVNGRNNQLAAGVSSFDTLPVPSSRESVVPRWAYFL